MIDGQYTNISLARAKRLPGARVTGKTSSAEFTIPVDELGAEAFPLKYDSATRTLNARPSEVMAAVSGNRAVVFDGEGVVAPMKWQVTNGQFLVLWADVDYPNVDYKQVKVQAYLPDDAWTIGAEGSPVSHEGSRVSVDMTGAGVSALVTVTEGMDGKVVVLENLPASTTSLTVKVAANVAVVDVTLPLGTDLTALAVVDGQGVPLYVANGSSGMPEDFAPLDRLQIVVENGVFYVRKVTNDVLPPYTIRFQADRAVTLSDFSQAVALHAVDDSRHIYDLYYKSNSWGGLMAGKQWLIRVLDANMEDLSASGIFGGSLNLEYVRISRAYNVSGVLMFGGNTKLRAVVLGDFSTVQSLDNIFNAALHALEYVRVDDCSACTDMHQMFYVCPSLKRYQLSKTDNVENINSICYDCSALKNISLFKTDNVTNAADAFNGCTKVESGALAFYQQLSTQENPPTSYVNAFKNCGADTETGLAELQQIPTSWGGLDEEALAMMPEPQGDSETEPQGGLAE